jgi:hypothetical protein
MMRAVGPGRARAKARHSTDACEKRAHSVELHGNSHCFLRPLQRAAAAAAQQARKQQTSDNDDDERPRAGEKQKSSTNLYLYFVVIDLSFDQSSSNPPPTTHTLHQTPMTPTMGRLIECQMAFVTWGMKARFRQGNMGLIRKDNKVYLALYFSKTEYYKLLVDPQSLAILPAAIRFKDLQKDLFIKNVVDTERYEHIKRGLRVLLRREELRRTGKGDKLDRFIASLPSLNSIRLEERTPSRVRSLELTQCNLNCVPKELENLSSTLEHLDMSRNNIDKLPRTFCCKMNKLRNLNLSHNLIETLPLEIKFFSQLVALNLSDNHLRLLPSTFSDLRALKTLNVANNNLSQLPAFRRTDITLEILDISCNPLDGALQNQLSTFEVYPSHDGQLGYEETPFSSSQTHLPPNKNKVSRLFEISLLNIVRCDRLFKLASEEALPRSIVSIMQRDVFKCYRCNQMNMLPAYNSTDYLDYVAHVTNLISTRNYSHGMTFMKLLCRDCFGNMAP